MKIGQVFTINGVKYGFLGLTKNKCVKAYNLAEERPVQFKMAYSKEVLIPELTFNTGAEISQKAVAVAMQLEIEDVDRKITMHSMRMGQRFLGADGNVYTFIRVKQTRFECERNDVSYTAQAGFIKEVL